MVEVEAGGTLDERHELVEAHPARDLAPLRVGVWVLGAHYGHLTKHRLSHEQRILLGHLWDSPEGRHQLPDLEVASVVGVERLELLDGDRRLEAELSEGEHAGDLLGTL